MRNNRGFTLVEMAIVLVIIGIILGAVVKGQDLINNGNQKKVITSVSTWRNLAYAFMDRNGRLPGDAGRDGIIGNNLTAANMPTATYERTGATGTATAEIVTSMINAPDNPVVVGGLSFWVYFGRGTATNNAIIICKAAACNAPFTTDELEVIKSLDTAFDGVADAGMGQIRGATAVAGMTGAATVGTPARQSRTNTGTTIADITPAGAARQWDTNQVAAVWLFDRPF